MSLQTVTYFTDRGKNPWRGSRVLDGVLGEMQGIAGHWEDHVADWKGRSENIEEGDNQKGSRCKGWQIWFYKSWNIFWKL